MSWFAVPVFVSVLMVSATSWAAMQYPELRKSIDPRLQKQLQLLISEKGFEQAVSEERLSITLVDISDTSKPRVASINGDVMEYAASLPKIAILLTAFVQIEQQELELDEKLEAELTDMIRHSSNAASTRLLELVGREKVLQTLQSPGFRFYDERYDGGLWIGKDYAKQGAYQRDPLHDLSHGASTMQVARFYYLLETNRLASPELTLRMKRILSDSAINHKFVKGLKARPGVKIYRKSGTWRHYHADSALVEYGKYKYIIVGLAEDSLGGEWLAGLAAPLHDLVVKQAPKE